MDKYHYQSVGNKNTLKAILRRIHVLNNCKGELYPHEKYLYIEQSDPEDNCEFGFIVYKNKVYTSKYVDGCFCPYIYRVSITKHTKNGYAEIRSFEPENFKMKMIDITNINNLKIVNYG